MSAASRRLVLAACCLVASAVSASAQSRGRVVVDRATIWRLEASVMAAQVRQNTVLDVRGRSDRWYEVVIPEALGGRGETGLIALRQLELLPGSGEPPLKRLRGSGPTDVAPPPATQGPTRGGPTAPTRRAAGRQPPVAVRGFGQLGYVAFNARDSFEAVLGRSHGPSFGGGAQMRFAHGLFVEGSFERFRKTGERVFVADDTVFPLGIDNTITIDALAATAGYRVQSGGRAVPYVGGGIGRYRFRESSPLAESGEDASGRHLGYHAMGGVEFRHARWLSTAIEGQFRTVPDALGSAGVSQLFDEHNLGGLQIEIKVLIGR